MDSKEEDFIWAQRVVQVFVSHNLVSIVHRGARCLQLCFILKYIRESDPIDCSELRNVL